MTRDLAYAFALKKGNEITLPFFAPSWHEALKVASDIIGNKISNEGWLSDVQFCCVGVWDYAAGELFPFPSHWLPFPLREVDKKVMVDPSLWSGKYAYWLDDQEPYFFDSQVAMYELLSVDELQNEEDVNYGE